MLMSAWLQAGNAGVEIDDETVELMGDVELW